MSTSRPDILRFRQIHLDFHTSEVITGIGAAFDKKQFQEALKRGHVDSVTIFAKCHHGLSYHDTKIGQRHPHLDFELMPRQIEACREIGVKCPIYISAGLDEYSAHIHPEWIAVSRDGHIHNPLQAGWKVMGFDTPYLDYLVAQIEEVVENYDAADGIFLDIIGARDNFSQLALTKMQAHGVDPTDPVQLTKWNNEVLEEYFRRTTAACKLNDDNRRVFHNSGHIPKGNHHEMSWNSHLELESLPTGGWGYDHFPLSAKYAATTGFDYLGMSGKFHTSWGEFGGFKRANALRYECAAMLAFGAKCSIGDQLHPDGAMNFDTYDLIGAAYKEVEEKEDWVRGAQAVSEIALVSSEARNYTKPDFRSGYAKPEEGASRMLLELHQQFDVIDLEHDLSAYKVVILPDIITVEDAFKAKLEAYIQNGGKVILSGDSGLTPDKSTFALDLGLELAGKSEYNPTYLVPTEKAPTPPVRGPFVVFGEVNNITAGAGWETFATRRDPYFNRAWNHFCSHQHTPDGSDSPYPAVVSNGQVAYFAHPIFTAYRELGQGLYRDILSDVLRSLVETPSVEATRPTTGRLSLMDQAEANRAILHLLFAVPVKRGADTGGWGTGSWATEIVEDLYPLYNVECKVRLQKPVKSVKLVPAGTEVPFETDGDTVKFSVPELVCHQMVELGY